MVCRVFQKSVAAKRPQQALSSREPSVESPCETNSFANEFGDIDLPNLNCMANSSSSTIHSNNISMQGFVANNNNINLANMMSLNNMNWTNSLPSLSSWPSNLLSPNLSMNSLLLKALQLRNNGVNYHQPRELPNIGHDNFISYNNLAQQENSQFGTDHISTTTNFQLASSSSSPKITNNVVDSASQAQPEQPFNLDSIW